MGSVAVPGSVRLMTIGLGVVLSSQALAVFDLQLLGGQRTATEEYETMAGDKEEMDIKSTDLTLALHVDPIPAVPVAFGLFASMNEFDRKKLVEEKISDLPAGGPLVVNEVDGSLKGTTFGPEILVWVPGIPVFSPYLRMSYVLGTYDLIETYDFAISGVDTEAESTLTYGASGFQYALGANFSIAPFVGLVLEYQMGNTDLTFKKGETVAGSETAEIEEDDLEDEDKKKTVKTSAIRLGIEVGL